MHRCYVETAHWRESEIRLDQDQTHHLLHVLRARSGEKVSVFDGRGREALGEIVGVRGRDAVLRLLEAPRFTKPPSCRLTLVQALPKGSRMDFIIEKATELNTRAITLEVRQSNRAAQALYEKYGFTKAGVRRRYYSDDGEDAVVMTTETITSGSYQARFQQLKQAYTQRWRTNHLS